MIEKINALKDKATERAIYYSKINFPNLAGEFAEFENILVEMKAIVEENEMLRTRVQALEEESRAKVLEAATARDGEECD